MTAICQHETLSVYGGTAWFIHEALLSTLMEQPTVTNPAVMYGLCAMIKHISNVLLAQARPTMMISSY